MKTTLIAMLAAIVLRADRHPATPESYGWVAGEVLPSEPGWSPRVSRLPRDARRA